MKMKSFHFVLGLIIMIEKKKIQEFKFGYLVYKIKRKEGTYSWRQDKFCELRQAANGFPQSRTVLAQQEGSSPVQGLHEAEFQAKRCRFCNYEWYCFL